MQLQKRGKKREYNSSGARNDNFAEKMAMTTGKGKTFHSILDNNVALLEKQFMNNNIFEY